MEDGTESANMKISDKEAISAFGISEDMINHYFKPYCTKFGNFFFGNSLRDEKHNEHMYDTIKKAFENRFSFSSISVVCIPYCKIRFDKSTGREMISRPNYVLSESDKSMPVYLNGEIIDSKASSKRFKTNRKIK